MDVLRLHAYLHRIQPGRPHRPHHIGLTSSAKISHGISGEYYIKLKEGQGVCCNVWNRHGTSVSCGVLWTLLRQGYHRNGLGFHHSTYFGQSHRNGVRGFLKNWRKDGTVNQSFNDPAYSNSDTFAIAGYIQQARISLCGKSQVHQGYFQACIVD